ncbi:MAG: hypothetical protein EOM90_11600 [Alphaproteobacteria bacterium]|nr:hypothetical protein [Alphaproteobacteria bacterium]
MIGAADFALPIAFLMPSPLKEFTMNPATPSRRKPSPKLFNGMVLMRRLCASCFPNGIIRSLIISFFLSFQPTFVKQKNKETNLLYNLYALLLYYINNKKP